MQQHSFLPLKILELRVVQVVQTVGGGFSRRNTVCIGLFLLIRRSLGGCLRVTGNWSSCHGVARVDVRVEAGRYVGKR